MQTVSPITAQTHNASGKKSFELTGSGFSDARMDLSDKRLIISGKLDEKIDGVVTHIDGRGISYDESGRFQINIISHGFEHPHMYSKRKGIFSIHARIPSVEFEKLQTALSNNDSMLDALMTALRRAQLSAEVFDSAGAKELARIVTLIQTSRITEANAENAVFL
jgi:hypothetical protein